ncbi:uncharacterized protein LOC128232720 [Mya arenaria]|uniref:uncharacterized protein LOC128232720 n=1 Tax=Mya arenaria TaxID=6604 RepID=UPI0022E8954A|nr:uncharacterized protein LOC128232720 [Mya arenaria]
MESIPLQCSVCVKSFSGVIPAQQHYASLEHKKKVENQAVARRGYGNYCEVCKITCDTSAILQIHSESPRHLAMVEKQRAMTNRNHQPASGNTDTREYHFDGQKGYCNICQIELTSSSHANDHLSGKNHKKRKQQTQILSNGLTASSPQRPLLQASQDYATAASATLASSREIQNGSSSIEKGYDFHGGRGVCHVCNIELTSNSHAQEHLRGKNHAKKKAQLETAKRFGKTMTPAYVQNLTSAVILPNLQTFNTATSVSEHKFQQPLGRGFSHTEANIAYLNEAHRELGHSSLFCDTCKVSFTGPESQAAHMAGEKHKKTLKKLEMESMGSQHPLKCNACNVVFTGQENAEDHFKGKKHERNMKNMSIKNTLESPTQVGPIDRSSPQYPALSVSPQELQTTNNPETLVVNQVTRYLESHVAGHENQNNVYCGDEKDKLHHFQDVGSSDDDSDSSDDISVKPLDSLPSSEVNNLDGHVAVQTHSSINDNQSWETESSLSSINIKSLSMECPVPGQRMNIERQHSVETDESKIRNETTVGIDQLTDDLSSLDIKSHFETSTEQSLSSSRFTEPYRVVQNDFSAGCSLLGRGRGFLQNFAKSQENLPGKVLNTAQRSTELRPNNETRQWGENASHEERSETFRKTVESPSSQNDFVGNKPMTTISEGNQPVQYQFNNEPRFHECSPSYTDDSRSESEGSLAQEGINFERFNTGYQTQLSPLQHQQNYQIQQTPEQCDLQGRNNQEVNFDPRMGRGQCFVCAIELTSVQHMQQHLTGKKHFKALQVQQQLQQMHRDDNMMCLACKVTFSGPESRQQHMQSERHFKKIQSLTEEKKEYYCDVCKVPCSGADNYQQHIEGAKHRKMTGTDLVGLTSPENAIDKTIWHTCPICFSKTNTEHHLRVHISAKHPGHELAVPRQLFGASHSPPAERVRLQPTVHIQQPPISPTTLNSGHTTPLQVFLSEPLFPPEFLPKEMQEGATGAQPEKVEVNITGPFQRPERFAEAAAFNDETCNDSGSCNKRGNLSDLAYATRNHNSGNDNASRILSSEMLGAKPKDGSSVLHNPYSANFPYYCHTCKSPMNTRDAYLSHINGNRHKQKVCTEPAPIREHVQGLDITSGYIPYTLTKPRNYQFELYEKAMARNALVFLPTGTGKTLVSVMTISAMLEKYPTRNILFLVDKVLLVMQQSQYIQQQLGDKTFNRFNDETEQTTDLVRRKIRVAALCMGQQATHGIPLWKHDIVVVTAGFCKNILEKKVIRWEDFSLIVVDEVHHCEKAHPYNVILSTYHLKQTPDRFGPTALGLTASPAGKASVQATVGMLNVLISNMGGAKMCIVENPECVSTLVQYQSNANLEARTPTDTSTTKTYAFENTFKTELNVYIMYCVLKLADISNIKEYVNIRPEMTPCMRDSIVRMIADNFVEEELDTIQISLCSIEKKSNNIDVVEFSMIKRHVQGVCMARSSVIDGGVFCAIQELAELGTVGFQFARSVGLPTAALQQLIKVDHAKFFLTSTSPSGIPDPSAVADHHVQNLINELTTTGRSGQGISLVLVKQRATAYHLAGILKNSPQLQRAGLHTTTMVGHGDGSAGSAGGMSVRAQKEVLEEIKQGKYQVVVATSVAEEGVDWPDCERVITMYPPSTVTALIQMRGRARRKDSKFIVLCSNLEEEEKLKDIMMREQNMIEATKWIVQLQRGNDS